jgi:hypothetical protein
MHCLHCSLHCCNRSFGQSIWTFHVLLVSLISSIFPAIIATIFHYIILQSYNHSNYYYGYHNDCQSNHRTQLHYLIHFKLPVSSALSLSYKYIASYPNYCSLVIPLLHDQTITACPKYCSTAIIMLHGNNLQHGQTTSAWWNYCRI